MPPKSRKKAAIRRASSSARLTAADMMRMATTDEQFAKALVRNPEKFKDLFDLKPAEIAALKRIPKIPRGPGGGPVAFDYDA